MNDFIMQFKKFLWTYLCIFVLFIFFVFLFFFDFISAFWLML